MPRPPRLQILDELGTRRTLGSGESAWQIYAHGTKADTPTLLLGIGPDVAEAVKMAGAGEVYLVECPAFEEQMNDAWFGAVDDAGLLRMAAGRLTPEFLRTVRIVFYAQSMKLFPSFWAPVLARVRLALGAQANFGDACGPAAKTDEVWIPGDASGLLVEDVRHGFAELGMAPHIVAEKQVASAPALASRLATSGAPRMVFCINGRGLDPLGEAYHLLATAGVEVVIWCVDNPFNVISRFGSRFFCRTTFCATDDSFAEPLNRLGVQRFMHLPLAAHAPIFASPRPLQANLHDRALFVGRSAFPHHDSFFAGIRTDPDLLGEAREMIERGARPDYWWWVTGCGSRRLWPGKGSRTPAAGAEATGRSLRARCIEELAGAIPTTVIGDAGWRALASGHYELAPPVDYYGPLMDAYASARVVAGATSPLLPRGLTQRHFDVWAAGGTLLSDHTPGLDFLATNSEGVEDTEGRDLLAETRARLVWKRPADIPACLRALEDDPALARDLPLAWKTRILAGHTYAQRLQRLFAS